MKIIHATQNHAIMKKKRDITIKIINKKILYIVQRRASNLRLPPNHTSNSKRNFAYSARDKRINLQRGKKMNLLFSLALVTCLSTLGAAAPIGKKQMKPEKSAILFDWFSQKTQLKRNCSSVKTNQKQQPSDAEFGPSSRADEPLQKPKKSLWRTQRLDTSKKTTLISLSSSPKTSKNCTNNSATSKHKKNFICTTNWSVTTPHGYTSDRKKLGNETFQSKISLKT